MVYWDQSCAGWRRFTALSDCRPRRNVPQPWQPLGEGTETDLRRRAAQEAAAAGGLEAGWPDLFCRDPAYVQRHRPCSATSSESGSGYVDERDTSPSARSDFLERVRRGDFATRDRLVPTIAAMRTDNSQRTAAQLLPPAQLRGEHTPTKWQLTRWATEEDARMAGRRCGATLPAAGEELARAGDAREAARGVAMVSRRILPRRRSL